MQSEQECIDVAHFIAQLPNFGLELVQLINIQNNYDNENHANGYQLGVFMNESIQALRYTNIPSLTFPSQKEIKLYLGQM